MRLLPGSFLVTALISALSIAACSGSSSDPPCPGCTSGGPIQPPDPSNSCVKDAPPADGKPAVVLGGSDSGADGGITPLMGGEMVSIQNGPQGGRHVFASVKLYAASTMGTWKLAFALDDDMTGTSFAEASTVVDACPDAWALSEDVAVILQGEPSASALLKLDATPPDGSAAIHVEVPITIVQ